MQSFGQCLTSIRQSRCLRQIDLAKLAIVDNSYIASLERDRRAPPKPRSLNKLLTALNATPEETLTLERAARVSRLIHLLNHSHHDTEGVKILLQIAQYIPDLARTNKIQALEEGVATCLAHLSSADQCIASSAPTAGEAHT